MSGFDKLTDWRQKYIHQGIVPALSADVERYIQLLFLDILRQELSLPPRFYMASIQKARGYDLSPLGLSDNREDDQKAKDKGEGVKMTPPTK
jgi:hypothetical protein